MDCSRRLIFGFARPNDDGEAGERTERRFGRAPANNDDGDGQTKHQRIVTTTTTTITTPPSPRGRVAVVALTR